MTLGPPIEPMWTLTDLVPASPMQPMVPNRGGYTLTMRECAGSEESLALLESDAAAASEAVGRLHLGWGSFRNLDVMAVRRSDWGLLLDVNFFQFQVWETVRLALLNSTGAAAFIEAVVPLLPTQPRLRQFSDSTLTWLRGDLERPGSWLFESRPDRYQHIRALFCKGRVAVACADLRSVSPAQGGGWFEELAGRMESARRAGKLVPDTLYVSNIPWMLAQPIGFFGESHAPYVREGGAVLDQVRGNLAQVVNSFSWVISAMRLRNDATADNLQWLTQLQQPDDFMAERDWRQLAEIPAAVG
ncbi:MAG TPA: hypothetical protein VGA59_12855 [Ramlibacter sp.]|jgi:hypothetical protein